MMTFDDMKRRWNGDQFQNQGYLGLGLDSHPLDIHIGYGADGKRSMVILNPERPLEGLPSSAAIEASYSEEEGVRMLTFHLLTREFEEEFLRLCWDLTDATAESEDALADLATRYLNWYNLLQSRRASMLPVQKQKGLLGELLYLQDCLEEMDPGRALKAWTGPEGADQDFQFEDGWAEVKSVDASAASVTISSLEQLAFPAQGYLVVFLLDKVSDGAETVSLAGTVEQLASVFGQDPLLLDRFETKLLKYGYRPAYANSYRDRFRLFGRQRYEVSASFPRITKQSVSPAIVRCSYGLSLAAIDPFRSED